MKIISATRRSGGKPAPAWMLAAINQLAFPGLGTIMAGRRAGWPQAALMVAGFCLTMAFLLWYLWCCFRYVWESSWDAGDWHAQFAPYYWVLHRGLLLCGVAWCWALFDSVAIMRAARRM